MISIELKRQARLQEWGTAIKECRSSGRSVREWCRKQGITPTTYYCWEREVMSVAGSMAQQDGQESVTFAKVPVSRQECRSEAERSATLYVVRTPLKKCNLTADDGASPPPEWRTHSTEMVYGGRGRGVAGRHARKLFRDTLALAHGLALNLDGIGVIDYTVTDGVSQGRVVQILVPLAGVSKCR